MFTNKPLQLWFSSVYCLRRKMQKAHGFLTAIFGYVWRSGHEPILFYISRTALVDYMRKTMTVVAAKADLCISLQLLSYIQTYFETTLKYLHLQCCGMYSSVALLSPKVCVHMNENFEYFFFFFSINAKASVDSGRLKIHWHHKWEQAKWPTVQKE